MKQTPPAETIERVYDAMGRQDAAALEADQARVAKEFHSANPAFIRGLDFPGFALAAHSFYLGVRVAQTMEADREALEKLIHPAPAD